MTLWIELLAMKGSTYFRVQRVKSCFRLGLTFLQPDSSPAKKINRTFFSSSSSRCSVSFRRRWKPDRVWTLSRASHLLLNVFLSPLSTSTSSSSWMNRHRRRWSSRPQMLSLPCLARSLVFWAQESLICDRCLDKKRSFCRQIFLKLNNTLLSKQYVWHSAMIRLLNN